MSKEKSKNLCSVFVRHLKLFPSGSGGESRKQYYLYEAMKSMHLYITIQGMSVGNLSKLPGQSHESNLKQHPPEVVPLLKINLRRKMKSFY